MVCKRNSLFVYATRRKKELEAQEEKKRQFEAAQLAKLMQEKQQLAKAEAEKPPQPIIPQVKMELSL